MSACFSSQESNDSYHVSYVRVSLFNVLCDDRHVVKHKTSFHGGSCFGCSLHYDVLKTVQEPGI